MKTSPARQFVAFALALLPLAVLLAASPASAATNVAVFNFQLKTGQDDWI